MHRFFEQIKVDIGVKAQALNNTNKTGAYFPLKDFRSALAILSSGHMAKTKTAKLELLQATGADGGESKVIASHDCLITANELVTELTIALDTVLNGETIEINGLTFTAHTDTEDKTIRQFDISGDNTADALSLANCVNDPTYGCKGILATPAVAVLTLTSTIPGAVVISAVSSDATFTVVTISAQSYVDLGELVLDIGFTHIACKITVTDTATWAAVVLLRYGAREKVFQKVGASYPV